MAQERGTAEILATKLTGLDLTEEEGVLLDGQVQDEVPTGLKFAAIAKILTKRPVNQIALVSTLGEIWGTRNAMECKSISSNLILFNFSHEKDRKRALDDGPWSFKDRPLIFAEFDGSVRPSDLDFISLAIWVRVYDLPMSLMNETMATKIGGMFGEVIEVDSDEDGWIWGECMRIHARIDISRPLRRGVMIKTNNNPEGEWFSAKFERVPHFCFTCGVVGHETCGCGEGRFRRGEKIKYSADLRAPAGRRNISLSQKRVEEPELEEAVAQRKETFSPREAASVEEGRTTRVSPMMGAEGGKESRDAVDGGIKEVVATVGDEELPDVGYPGDPAIQTKVGVTQAITKSSAIPGRARDQKMDVDEEIRVVLADLTNSKRKRALASHERAAAATAGKGAIYFDENGTGPIQKRRREVQLSLLPQNSPDSTAKAAGKQPRRSQ